MLLNKVLFGLLVLGLCFVQPSFGITGGIAANSSQFPFVALITFNYTNSAGTFSYQGTGVIYNSVTVITSANAMALCVGSNSIATVYQGVTLVNNQTGANIISFQCSSTTVKNAPGFSSGSFAFDFASIDLSATGLSFTGTVALRTSTSSPTAADNGNLYAIGFGELYPGGPSTPVLEFLPVNFQTNNVCQQRATQVGFSRATGTPASQTGSSGKYSFAINFCLAAFQNSTFVTDVCTLDAGGPIIRTKNINNPLADFEVIGIINWGSCQGVTPIFATYLFQFLANSTLSNSTQVFALPSQDSTQPGTASPANTNADNGNFACGDGVVSSGVTEKCDPADTTDPNYDCCNPFTCQLRTTVDKKSTPCSTNRNGTHCIQMSRCNRRGVCVQKFKRNTACTPGARGTKCHLGMCCTYVNGVKGSCV